MDEHSREYLLDQAFTSIAAFKQATDVVNAKPVDKSSKMTPTQKLKHLTKFVNDEHDRIMVEYDKYAKD